MTKQFVAVVLQNILFQIFWYKKQYGALTETNCLFQFPSLRMPRLNVESVITFRIFVFLILRCYNFGIKMICAAEENLSVILSAAQYICPKTNSIQENCRNFIFLKLSLNHPCFINCFRLPRRQYYTLSLRSVYEIL